jgi:hypothetical protein
MPFLYGIFRKLTIVFRNRYSFSNDKFLIETTRLTLLVPLCYFLKPFFLE